MTIEADSITNSAEESGNDDSQAGVEAGKPCPICHIGIVDYDGLLNLVCPVCGFTQGGCFT